MSGTELFHRIGIGNTQIEPEEKREARSQIALGYEALTKVRSILCGSINYKDGDQGHGWPTCSGDFKASEALKNDLQKLLTSQSFNSPPLPNLRFITASKFITLQSAS
jgi:hypothetical protein